MSDKHISQETYIFKYNRLINKSYEIKKAICDMLKEDLMTCINNNGYNDQITQLLINEHMALCEYLGVDF